MSDKFSCEVPIYLAKFSDKESIQTDSYHGLMANEIMAHTSNLISKFDIKHHAIALLPGAHFTNMV